MNQLISSIKKSSNFTHEVGQYGSRISHWLPALSENMMNKIFSAVAAVGLLTYLSPAQADIDIAQSPIFVSAAVPPLNMLVMGRDHKLYYEAYNDASDLNGDGKLDIGYKGYLLPTQGGIDYYGYFNSKVCYTHDTSKFVPAVLGTGSNGKECSGKWSGDFLNYVATARIDALRKVLYGGYRSTDSTTETVLQASYIPQDAHSWGKEYTSVAINGYDISLYTPLTLPNTGLRHLFAVTSTAENAAPKLRVLNDSAFRIWNWVSKERPVADTNCVNSSGSTVTCATTGTSGPWAEVPASALSGLTVTTWKDNIASPANTAAMDSLFSPTNNTNSTRCGTGTTAQVRSSGTSNSNPFVPGASSCTQDGYHTLIEGTLTVPTTGTYSFAVDGDDAVDFTINGTLVASWYDGHGANNSATSLTSHSGTAYLTAGQAYTIKFRHEEGSGGDGWNLYFTSPSSVASSMTDYSIRVAACTAGPGGATDTTLQETSCKGYPSGSYKPTGILHDYGQTNRMYFGLLSGSYAKNMSGGILRSNIQSFTNELNLTTGQFSAVSGIVDTINKLRTYDFDYNNNYQYGCGFISSRRMRQTDTCYMWGNPIGEMMYEATRYFAGATTPTPLYDYTTGPDVTLALPKPGWTPPYSAVSNGRAAYPSCSVPAMTVISDINPSYDFKLPGGKASWQTENGGTAFSNSGDPTAIRGLDVSTEVDAIWTAEGTASRNIFIGESNGVSDDAPTAKTVTNLSTVRGLAPEEPTKSGTYYSAGISRFAAQHNIGGDKKLLTYSVALASPLPKIEFPVGNNRTVTVVPFAKSVQNNSYKPTNQIVDFYIAEIANTDSNNTNITVNSGRPYAKFRINYEDVEQGADHDMDAIALYTLSLNAAGTLDIRLDSEYAAGGAVQNMGYIISGTTNDGIFLEICDLANNSTTVCDSPGAYFYGLNTPPGRNPGYCASKSNDPECKSLPIASTRTFTGSNTSSASLLNDPLWYAAKYGNTSPTWDADLNGVPDNYFLVTNALTLKAQLDKAFGDLSQKNNSVSRPAAGREPVSNSTSTLQAIYRTEFEVESWSGDLIKETYSTTGVATEIWKASDNVPTTRNIKMGNATGTALIDFNWTNLASRSFDGVELQTALNLNPTTTVNDSSGPARVKFIRGESCASLTGCSTFRTKDKKLGDIIGSSPVLVKGAQYLSYLADRIDGAAGDYSTFKTNQAARRGQIYVGANDGMLHAFNEADGAETLAFIPTAVIRNLNRLPAADYTSQSSDNHHYYVDGAISVTDVYFGGAWHTVLVGALGAGGKEVFALDVTDPDNVSLLWEFTSDSISSGVCDTSSGCVTTSPCTASNNCISDLGFSLPAPVTARLHNGKWGVVIANGYNSANNGTGKAVLFVLNIQDGSLVKRLDAQGETAANGLSSPKLADNNSDGVADYAYAGDLQGNLWRFDLIGTAATATPFARTNDRNSLADEFRVGFSGAALYQARTGGGVPTKQSITSAPSLIRHPTRLGYIVAFGTGRYLGVTDKVSPYQMQTLYGIWDRQTLGQTASTTPTLNRSNLQQQTITSALSATFGTGDAAITRNVRILSNTAVAWFSATNTAGKYGWYLDLSATTTSAGERIVDDMIKRGDVLIINTRTPNSDPCESGVDGRYYGIDPSTGGRTTFNVFDLNGDGKLNAADSQSSTPISGVDADAGGTIITDGDGGPLEKPCLRGSDGKCTTIDLGPNSSGRQNWRVVPQD
jgi:type IV pilus assembly protein PilY1